MLFPVRCFTCNKPIGHLDDVYLNRIKTETVKDVLDSLGIVRYCCRRMFISYSPIIDNLVKYN